MPKKKLDSWWPVPLAHVPKIKFLADEMVTVSEISNGAQLGSTRDVHLALLDMDVADRLVKRTRHLPVSYNPGTGLCLESRRLKIEALSIKWQGGGNHFVQVPSPKFLQYFGLVPRLLEGISVWDDLEKPLHNIVHAVMDSVYDYPNTGQALIRIRRDYLLRYAHESNRAIVALWYEWNTSSNRDLNGRPYSAHEFGTFALPGRIVQYGESSYQNGEVVAEFWGVLPVYSPRAEDAFSPPSRNSESLIWPGIDQPVGRRTRWHPAAQQVVYVKDSVLDMYEERPDLYTVHADSGAVSYKNQWSVERCRRVGRDLISVEIKKLYEGAPDDTIKHWHVHSVPGPVKLLCDSANIGTRSKRIVFGLLSLGDALSDLSALTRDLNVSARDFVGLDGEKLRRNWWYDDELVQPITRRIPMDMGKDAFLSRCKAMTRLVVEGLGQSHIRNMLLNLGANKKELEDFGSLKLLDRVLQLTRISTETGLEIVDQYESIQARFREEHSALASGQFMPTPIGFLYLLYDLRIMDAHRGGTETKVLSKLGIHQAHVLSGWGLQADRVYDCVGDALEASTRAIRLVL